VEGVLERRLKPYRHRAGRAVANGQVVDLPYRRELGGGPCHEQLVGRDPLRARDVAFVCV